MTDTASTDWVPSTSGSTCVMIRLLDPEGIYEPQVSQRNVYVEEQVPCGQTHVYTTTLYNNSQLTATVDIGLADFNVPEDWVVTVTPGPTIELGPFSSVVLTISVTIPCPENAEAFASEQLLHNLQAQANSTPTIDVEGYIDGVLVGGVELRFPSVLPPTIIYLPVIRR
jgi:hypothetical protein